MRTTNLVVELLVESYIYQFFVTINGRDFKKVGNPVIISAKL